MDLAERNATTAADLRALAGAANVAWYKVGALADLHPSRLSSYMNGHLPLTPKIASRIATAIRAAAGR